MGFNNDAKNAMLNEFGTLAVYVSLHTASPATSGNEISGGSPAYARKAINWGTASGGSMTASNQPVFDVPAGKTVAAVGFWSAATGGTLYGDDDVTSETFANQGTYTLTSVTLSLT